MDEQVPQSGLEKFKSSPWAYPMGVVLALLLGVGLFYIGLYNQLCGMGMVLIAAGMFIIIKWFSGKNALKMYAYGIIFMLVITMVGAFAFSAPMIDNNDDWEEFDSDGFSNVVLMRGDNTITQVDVKYDGTLAEGEEIYFRMTKVAWIVYERYNTFHTDNDDTLLTYDPESGRYTATTSYKIDGDAPYVFGFYKKSGEDTEFTGTVFFTEYLDHGNEIRFAITWNAYYTVIVLVLYLIIVFFAVRASKNLQKVRKQMEEEGRLYPQGYGRCKQCGTVVLPGETVCRKCGAYIEVPEEIKQNKVEYFECSECGAEIPSDCEFCPKCGAKFDEEDETVVVKEKKE